MENMNLINDSEMEGIKFLQQFGEVTRESDSLNQQINQIQVIIAMIQNEISQATVDEQNIQEVFNMEQKMIVEREKMTKENDKKITADIKEQCKALESNLNEIESMQTKQSFIHEGLSTKQQVVLDELEKQSEALEKERETLQREKEELQVKVRTAQKENQDRENKSEKLDSEVAQLQIRIDTMEDNLDKLVFENVAQFDQYQDIVHENNLNIDKMRDDLNKVQKQHFEMENINESLEQRIDQLKGQKDLSVLLTRTGQANELKSLQDDANRLSQKMVDLLNNTELSWEDKLVVKMRELDDAMRQSSEKSINK